MSLENVFYETISKASSSKSDYDSLVLFSGGKDSTYLAHLLKKAKGKRVCLFSVDNSFEDDKHVKVVAAKLNLDLYIHQPKDEEVNNFYNFLLSDPIVKEIDENPLCFLCNRYLTSLGVEFAQKYDIPFVVSGHTASQIFGSKVELSVRLIDIAERVLNSRYDKTYELLKTTDRYKQDAVIKKIVDRMFVMPDNVAILRPFLYYDYHIEKIKKELEEVYGWENPIPNIKNDEYVTSGCKLTELFGCFERKLGFKIREYKEYQLEYDSGSLSLEGLNHGTEFLNNLINKEITPEMRAIITKLKLDDQLL